MDSIRKFFANFQKHGTICWSSTKRVKVLKNGDNNSTDQAKGILAKDDIEIEDESKKQEDSTGNSKDFENSEATIPEAVKSIDANKTPSVNIERNCTHIDNTSKCLEEFDEILQEINIDINTESITLDDVDDVLNKITEESINFETPRFDLQDLVDNFGLSFEHNDIETTNNFKAIEDENIESIYLDIDDFIDPNNLDDYTEPIKIDDFIGPDNLDEDIETKRVDENFDADDLVEDITKVSEDFIQLQRKISDVISISSDDSQDYEPELKLQDNKEISEPKNIKLDRYNERDTHEPRNINNVTENLGLQSQDEILREDFNFDSEPKFKRKETKNANLCDKLNVKPNNVNKLLNSDPFMKDIIDEKETTDESGHVNHKNKGLDSLSEDIIYFYSEPKEKDGTTNENNNEEINLEQKNEELNESKSQEVLFIYNFQKNPHYEERDEHKSILEAKEPINLIDESDNSQDIISINDSDESETLNDKNNKLQESNTKSQEYDSDDCGYLSSDFEFITEEEAKLDGLIVNFNPNILKKINKPKRVKTIEISVDRYSNKLYSSISSESIQDDDSCMNNEFELKSRNAESINLHRSSQTQNCVDTSNKNNVQENGTIGSLRSFRRNLDSHLSPRNCPDSMKENCIKPLIDQTGLNLLRNDPEFFGHTIQRQENLGPSDSTDDRPSDFEENLIPFDFENRLGLNLARNVPGPSNVERNRQGRSDFREYRHEPNILQRTERQRGSLRTSDGDIQRWRAFQQRRRNQFILDLSYRDHHSVSANEDCYQLFNPNYLPLPTQGFIMENKSTLSTMMIEYEGIGFDMQMMREDRESEDDEVKEEATACARRILEMYPRENRKRRRRF